MNASQVDQIRFCAEKGTIMTTKTDLSHAHLQVETKDSSWNSWFRCFALFLSLSSASLLNMCNGAMASGSHHADACIRIAGLACECMSVLEPNTTAVTSTAAVDVMRVDEDWELVVTEPDPDVAAPQIQTVMSPFQDLNGFYISFLVNYRNNPQLAVGGLEVQFWYGDNQLGARRLDRAVLQQANETITWTQRLMIKGTAGDRYLCFRIVDGASASWGTFGGSEPLHMNIDTSNSDLSGYGSSFSVANSGVTYSSNRVARLVLKAVRGYSEDGSLVFEETNPVVVYDGALQ
jgi:hypothetical protein